MIALTQFKDQTIAVLGLGKSGLTAAQALQAGGAQVLAWDDEAEKREAAKTVGIPVADLAQADFSKIKMLVLSPGIPHGFPEPHQVTVRAKAVKVPLICDVDLLLQAQPQTDVIGITGTNGKSTTTALIGHILQNFRPAEIGGNIGRPALTLPPLGNAGTYVLELSSYQLELLPSLKASGAILLNLTPDHIDRHGDMAGYVAAKEKLFASGGRIAVIGVDTEPSKELAERVRRSGKWDIVIPVSTQTALPQGICVINGKLYDHDVFILDLSETPNLKGVHNHENIACAYAVIRHFYGYAPVDICQHIKTFPGLPHRQYPVRAIGNVSYINDSKATNADATARALACYDDIYWIIGGLPKEGGLSGLESYKSRIKHAFLIGKAANDFAIWLDAQDIPYTQCGVLERAVAEAHAMAQSAGKGTVLLSPACASWDQFKSFEHRGDQFAAFVNALPGAIAA